MGRSRSWRADLPILKPRAASLRQRRRSGPTGCRCGACWGWRSPRGRRLLHQGADHRAHQSRTGTTERLPTDGRAAQLAHARCRSEPPTRGRMSSPWKSDGGATVRGSRGCDLSQRRSTSQAVCGSRVAARYDESRGPRCASLRRPGIRLRVPAAFERASYPGGYWPSSHTCGSGSSSPSVRLPFFSSVAGCCSAHRLALVTESPATCVGVVRAFGTGTVGAVRGVGA